jgi:plasmid maintenance system antidote protein VapI
MAEKVNTHLLNNAEASRLSNADILKELSKRYEKLNQSKLAEAIGITQQAVNKLLNK